MSAYGPVRQSQEIPNSHANIGLQPEQDQQFIEKSYHRQQVVMRNKKQKRKKTRKGYLMKIIDKLLLFVALLFVCCAFSTQLYVKRLMNDYRIEEEERIRAEQEESQKLTTQILKKYNEKILKLKNKKHSSRKSISKKQKVVRSKLTELEQKNCEQFLKLPSYILPNQMLNPYLQQDTLQMEQRQELDKNKKQYDKTISELHKQQDKIKWQTTRQEQEVIRINKEYDAMGIPKEISRPVGGVTAQRLQAAKQLKNLVVIDPWQSSQLAEAQFNYYDKYYNISKYQQLPFCIVVPTFNNQQNQRYKHNLNSIVQQNYTNYHVVIIEDASTDQTGPLLDKYVEIVKQQWQKRNKKINIDVYHNKQQQRAMPNLRKAAMEYCQAHQIYMIVDGDDQLVGRNVFKLFNSQFQSKKGWFVYSNFMSFVGTIGYSRPFKKEIMQQNRYRQANFVTSHLRAFYTQLFRLIRQQDLKSENGQYLKAANDVAICLPILQMSHMRVSYIAQITYMYNSNTGLNNHLVRLQEQINNSKLIRSRPKYTALTDLKFQY